jgi:uncharacterized protein (DUF1697 family)
MHRRLSGKMHGMAERYAAFLRGINVGGRRVGGPDLVAAFETIEGIVDATPFLASGNIAFTDKRRRKPATVESRIEEAIASAFGWESKTFLRTAAAMAELAAAEPFTPAQIEASAGKHQVVILDSEPSAGERKRVLALASDQDLLVLEGPNLHWLPSGGYAESDLDLDSVAGIVGVGTTRTKNTIARMHAKFFADAD